MLSTSSNLSLAPQITLSRDVLQIAKTEAIAYGAKDTGEMGGGAAAGIFCAAGPQVFSALQQKLASANHQVGEVLATEAYGLRQNGVKWILHIISIIKNTPDGAYCPNPNRLRIGVFSAMKLVHECGGSSISFSALGTGEGRVEPRTAAQLMIGGLKDFQHQFPHARISAHFCLPALRDFEAFQAVMQGR